MRSLPRRLLARLRAWLRALFRRRPPIPGRTTVVIERPRLRVPLGAVGLPGAVAVLRPFDLYDHAKWHDAFPGMPTATEPNVAAIAMVRAHLVAIEGLDMVHTDGQGRPRAEAFAPSDVRHMAALPPAVVRRLYAALLTLDGGDATAETPEVAHG